MDTIVEIILVQNDGSLIVPLEDRKSGKIGSMSIGGFSGHIGGSEEPIDAAVREINEQTNLELDKEQLQFYRKFHKTKNENDEETGVNIFVATHISLSELKEYGPKSYAVIHDASELSKYKMPVLLKRVFNDYFEGFRSYLFQADMSDNVIASMANEYYAKITYGKKPTEFRNPIAIACTGVVASGKTTITYPLASMIGAVVVSGDQIREMFFRAGYNFKQLKPFIRKVLTLLVVEKYNIFLDFNISTNIPILDSLNSEKYKIYVVYANPPESFIKHKILSGNMKHELTFFQKDEYVYDSMLTWKNQCISKIPLLREKYGIWFEVDTSRKDLKDVIEQMKTKLMQDIEQNT